jgi:hypothetical protein
MFIQFFAVEAVKAHSQRKQIFRHGAANCDLQPHGIDRPAPWYRQSCYTGASLNGPARYATEQIVLANRAGWSLRGS